MNNNKKRIILLKQLLDNGQQLISLPYNNQRYSLWIAQVETTLREFFGNDSMEAINFDKHVRSYGKQGPTEKEYQQFYDRELTGNIAYIEKIISGLEQAIKIQQTSRLEIIYQNIFHGLRSLWQETIRAGVEGIVNGLKKH